MLTPRAIWNDERRSRRGKGAGEGPAERVHRDGVADQVGGEPEDSRVEDKDEQKPAERP